MMQRMQTFDLLRPRTTLNAMNEEVRVFDPAGKIRAAVSVITGSTVEPRGLGFHLYGGGLYPGGSRMSLGSYGHTGYTGTSLYVDNDTGVWVVLLTNRVHYGRDRDIFFVRRRLFHDTVFG